MSRHKILLLFLIIGLSQSIVLSQNLKLKGKVTDPYKNNPVVGAIVSFSNREGSVETNINGEFEVELEKLNGEISVWSPGYYTYVLKINNQTEVNVVLIPQDKHGYAEKMIIPILGVENTSEKYTNITSIQKNGINLNKTDIDQSLVNIPGLQLIGKSGMSGEGNYINIRNSNSFIAKSSPLIVVNGMPYMPDMNESATIGGWSRNVLLSLNAKDIENITVLKGSETSVYGSLGSNGVIMIETDKAIDLDTKVEFITQFGSMSNQAKFPLLGVSDYKRYIGNVALTKYPDMANVLDAFPYLIDDPTYYKKFLYNNDTDWQNLIYKNGLFTDNVLKIKGGDAIAKYDISLGYQNNTSQLKGAGYTKFHTRLNADVNLSKKMSFSSSVLMTYVSSNMQEQGMIEQTNPLLSALKKAPLLSPYQKDADNNLLPDFATIRDEFGHLIENNMVSNPLAVVNDVKMKEHLYDVFTNFALNYKWTKELSLKGIFGLYYFKNYQSAFVPGVSNKTIMPFDDGVAINTIRAGQSETFNTYFNLYSNYAKIFNEVHAVKASLGTQVAMNKSEYDAGSGINSSSDFYKTLNYISTVGGRSFYGYNDAWNWINFNFNTQYVYNNIVAAGIKLTSDASSSTGSDANLFQLYPALNVAWYGKNSLFSKNKFINNFTLRAEYFATGNSQFPTTISKYYYSNLSFRQLSGLTRAGIPNTKIQPELSQTLNVGADISLMNHRIDITLDAYRTMKSKMLMPTPISPAYGVGYLYENIGESLNPGIEAGIQIAAVQTKDIKWYIGGTISLTKNKITNLGEQNSLVMNLADGSALISEVGSSIYNFYGFQTDGVFSTTEEANTAHNGTSPLKNIAGTAFSAGDIRFVDQNTDGIIDDRDKVKLGSSLPDYYGTVYTSLKIKEFELSANFAYSVGNKMYNAVRRSMESMQDFSNQLVSTKRRWISEGQITDMPRAIYGDPMDNSRFSDRWIEDASFIKLKEVMLSYNLNLFNGTTLFLSGENLFTITNYLGLDPETMYSYDSSMRGFDYAKIPHPRVLKIGLKVQF